MATKLLKKQFNLPLNKTISNNSKCFIVAEISANHSGDLKLLKKTMLEAKKIGADAVKIQFGKGKNYIAYIKKQKHLLSGIKKYLSSLKEIKFYAFQLHLISRRLNY